MNHGLQLLPPITEEGHPQRHWIFGGFTGNADKSVLMTAGHGWAAFAPPTEEQAQNGIETCACTVYGTHHALCALARAKGFTDFPLDASERYTGVMAGVYPPGSDPHAVIQCIRNISGVIPESFLPFSSDIETVDEFYAPKPMLPEYRQIGSSLLQKFGFGHEWVIPPGSNMTVAQKQAALKDALQYGTVAVSVYAWRFNGTAYYKMPDDRDEHWVWLQDYVYGQSWLVRDSYPEFDKTLVWEYDFQAAKLYTLDRRTVPQTRNFGYWLWYILNDRLKRGLIPYIGKLWSGLRGK